MTEVLKGVLRCFKLFVGYGYGDSLAFWLKGSAMEREEHERCRCFGPKSRPRLKRWLQRRLRSTQPIPSKGLRCERKLKEIEEQNVARSGVDHLHRSWMQLLVDRCGAALHISGALVYAACAESGQSVVELRHDYTDEVVDGNGVGSLKSRLGGCGAAVSFEIKVDRDMEAPIWA